MTLAIIEKSGLKEFVADLIGRAGKVIGVKEEAAVSGMPSDRGFYRYDFLSSPAELVLSFDVTQIPPKKYLQPACEKLFGYDLPAGEAMEVTPPGGDVILFGVHPYDIIAINQMDKVFSAAPQDTHYLERRKRTTIIGIDPVRVAPRAFWSSMGAHSADSGFDLMLTDIGQCYTVEVGSPKGTSLMEMTHARSATSAEVNERDRTRAEVKKRCDAHGLRFPFLELPGLLKGKEDDVIWEEKARLCFSCGTCNLVCPTCYCFDVRDEVSIDLGKGSRYRTWDGCLLSDFARVAGGGNFRGHRADRYRHRFYRKGQFLFHRFGDIACVGCGRCSRQCPSDIADPVAVFNRLKEGI